MIALADRTLARRDGLVVFGLPGGQGSGKSTLAAALSDAAVARFVAHYERITRHMLNDLPGRADLVIELDRNRQVSRIRP